MTNEKAIRVLIVDDHAMVRKGLTAFLKAAPDLELVGEAASGPAALALVEQTSPDVVLMDLIMPGMDGVATTRAIREKYPHIQIIALTSFGDNDLVQAALQAGAISYLLKDVDADELAEAIRAARAGRPRLAPEAMQALVGVISRPPPLGHDLTSRELEVLALMVEGLNNSEIAARLVISRSTVKTHVSSILSKLEVASRVEAVTFALQNGLVN